MSTTVPNANADRRKYRRLMNEAEKALDTAVAAATAQFAQDTTAAQAAFDKIVKPAQAEFEKVAKPARETQLAAIKTAQEAYSAAVIKARTDSGYDF